MTHYKGRRRCPGREDDGRCVVAVSDKRQQLCQCHRNLDTQLLPVNKTVCKNVQCHAVTQPYYYFCVLNYIIYMCNAAYKPTGQIICSKAVGNCLKRYFNHTLLLYTTLAITLACNVHVHVHVNILTSKEDGETGGSSTRTLNHCSSTEAQQMRPGRS